MAHLKLVFFRFLIMKDAFLFIRILSHICDSSCGSRTRECIAVPVFGYAWSANGDFPSDPP